MSTTPDYDHDRALMFRVYFDADPSDTLFSWLESWLTSMSPWASEDHPENELPTITEPDDPSLDPYYQADWWFSWDEDKAIIYDQLIAPTETTGYLVSYTNWCRVGYHDCSHPSDEPSACSWNEQREAGPVPAHIVDMSP